MVELLILFIFCLFIIFLELFQEWKKSKNKLTKRQKYDVVFEYFFHKHAQNDEIPIFMNKRAFKCAHADTVQIAQEGKLNKYYKAIKTGVL